MQLTQISYIKAVSLELLQQAVAEEILQKTLEGQVFIQALPLVSKMNMANIWVQPLVFSFQAEAEEADVFEDVTHTFPAASLEDAFGMIFGNHNLKVVEDE